MAKNHLQDGNTLDWSNGSDTKVFSGQAVILGSIVGVACSDVPAGSAGVLFMSGVFTLPKVPAETWKIGTSLFFHPSGALTVNSKEGTDKPVWLARAGTAWSAQEAGDSQAFVRLGY
ncbi:hypothetical protein ASE93_12345 [Serratia sp. Leaf50]|nr:hypothetical protein ASE93_12345 [Serratia sp. Leaf50]